VGEENGFCMGVTLLIVGRKNPQKYCKIFWFFSVEIMRRKNSKANNGYLNFHLNVQKKNVITDQYPFLEGELRKKNLKGPFSLFFNKNFYKEIFLIFLHY